MFDYQKLSNFILLLSGFIFNLPTLADDGTLTMLVGNCESCHGIQGSSLGPAIPTIASMEEEAFVDTMNEYKSGERPSTIMGRIARGYSEEDFKLMATYFAKQPFIRYPQPTDAKQVQIGEKLHKNYCESCHEQGGMFGEDGTSILAGQWQLYLQFSFTDFRSGAREMPRKMKKRLQKMISEHGEASLDSILHFYASQSQMTSPSPQFIDNHLPEKH
jgi:sulfide dehydrogenase cytochrome subunit